MRIAVIGLGPMGRAMAGRLLAAGHEVTVFNRTAARAEALAAAGATIASSPADAAARAGTVLTIVSDDPATDAVAFGPGGVLAGLPAGGLHIVAGTISIALADRLDAAHRAAGQHYISAHVLGRPPAAEAGQLFIMAAGEAAAIARAQPLFDAIGQRVFVVGERPMQANTVKLCCNFLIFSTIEQFGEVFALAGKAGVDRAAMLEVLTGSFFNAPVHRNYGKLIVDGVFDPPGVTVGLAAKDTRLLLQAGEQLAVPLPFGSVVRDRFLSAIARGEQDKDFAILGRHAERDAGIES